MSSKYNLQKIGSSSLGLLLSLGFLGCKGQLNASVVPASKFVCSPDPAATPTVSIDFSSQEQQVPSSNLVAGRMTSTPASGPDAVALGSWCVSYAAPLGVADSPAVPLATLHFSVQPPTQVGIIEIHFVPTQGNESVLVPSLVTRNNDSWEVSLLTQLNSGTYTIFLKTDVDATIQAQTVAAAGQATQEGAVALSGTVANIEASNSSTGTVWQLREIAGAQLPPPTAGNVVQAIKVEGGG